MKKLRLSLLIIVLCLLGSKSQAKEVVFDGNGTLTITLDKDEHLSENDVKGYYDTATKVIVKTNTSDEETLSNLTYLVPADFEILNKFTAATTMDLQSVNYLLSDISLKGESLKYVRLKDGIKNIQQAWFGSAIEGAYSYSLEGATGATNAYCVYCNNLSDTGGKISDIFNALASKDNFSLDNNDPHWLNLNNNEVHYYVLVNGKINSSDVDFLKSTLHYNAIDMSLLNAHYVDNNGKPNYGDFVLRDINGKLKSIALPSDMDSIANDCLSSCNSLTKIIIPDGVKSIGTEAFRDCDHITSINIPEGCTTIGSSAFLNTRLQAVKLPSTLTSIGDDAFKGNKDLTSITFPKPADGVTLSLGKTVFIGCDNLRDIYITSTAPTIVNKTDSIEGTFTNTQQGLNVYKNNLKSGEVTFDDYRTDSGDKPIFLHYPKGQGKDYGHVSDEDCRKAKYTYDGKEGYKQANGYMDKYPQGEEAKNWYEQHTGWSRFVFASEYEGKPIPVPDQYDKDRWYTMCFPFNLTRKQIEDTFGSGTEVCAFQYVEKETIGNALVYSIRFNHDLIVDGVEDDGNPITPGSKIITKADQPYMIHPSQKPDNGQYQITDGDRVEYEEKDGQTVEKGNSIDFNTTGRTAGYFNSIVSKATSSDPAHVEAVFKGNYKKQLIPYGAFFLAKSEYYKMEASSDQTRQTGWLNPYTAYVQITDKDFKAEKYIADLQNNGLSNQAKIVYPSQWGEDDMSSSTTTAILPVHVASKPVAMENARIYNLQGQLVGIGADTLKTLHNGIYVMNGKKYVIR